MRRWSQTFIGRQASPRPTCPVFRIIIIIIIVAVLRNPSIKTSLRLSRIFHFIAVNSCCCCCCCGLYQAQQGYQLVPNTTSPPQLATRLYLLYTFYLYCRAGLSTRCGGSGFDLLWIRKLHFAKLASGFFSTATIKVNYTKNLKHLTGNKFQ